VVGHWGPRRARISMCSNRSHKDDLDMFYIAGPGQLAPGMLARYLEGTGVKSNPNVIRTRLDSKRIPSSSPSRGIPAMLRQRLRGPHEGGELGYSLSMRSGRIRKNKSA